MKPFSCAIVGASGMVGEMFIKVLEERRLPVSSLHLFASARSAGQKIRYNGQDLKIEMLTQDVFGTGIDVALFGVDSETSKIYAPAAVKAGCTVVDNSSAWRMADSVPLVVPEVNGSDLSNHKGIIANPNCCATPAVVALKPLLDNYGLERVIISTYQSVSGSGVNGIKDLEITSQGEKPQHFPYVIAGNLIPHIDQFYDDGYTGEERKIMSEIRKILHSPSLPITVTTVRVPVKYGHSLSINVTLKKDFELNAVQKLLNDSPGVVLQDAPANNLYPMPLYAAGTNAVCIGRVRRDNSFANSLNMWVVTDNTRKGAATNAVQIIESLFVSE
jgi:aspartate-semialdehyde dehydrogenase